MKDGRMFMVRVWREDKGENNVQDGWGEENDGGVCLARESTALIFVGNTLRGKLGVPMADEVDGNNGGEPFQEERW
jgi:hypothetical protein